MLDDIAIKYIKHIKDIMSFKHSKEQLSELSWCWASSGFMFIRKQHPTSNLGLLEMSNTGKRKSFPEITFPEKKHRNWTKTHSEQKPQNFWALV